MIKDAFRALRTAQRPVLIFGAGVRLSGAGQEARELARRLGIPVAPTWGARDLFPEGDGMLVVGGFGTHGTRPANFAVQNADWVLSVGSRLDSKATGTPREYFARGAQVFMADIDPAEIAKFKERLGRVFLGATADARLFLSTALRIVGEEGPWPDFSVWRARCVDWLKHYPPGNTWTDLAGPVDPYLLVRELSAQCEEGEIIVSDTGLSLAWMMQAFEFKEGQRFLHPLNQTPMGCGLPMAIGAAFACPGRRIVLVTGDGGLMLNIQELALLPKHSLPIKIILFNNMGHAMCRQTQDQWLGGQYVSTSIEGGLAMPHFCSVARGFDVASNIARHNDAVAETLEQCFLHDGPALLDTRVDPAAKLVPQVPYGTPNEDGSPKLPREQLAKEMYVELVT